MRVTPTASVNNPDNTGSTSPVRCSVASAASSLNSSLRRVTTWSIVPLLAPVTSIRA